MVHFPEATLLTCCQRSLVSQRGIWVYGKRQVLQNESNLAWMFFDGFFQRRICLQAEWALVIKEFDDSNRRFGVVDDLFTPVLFRERLAVRLRDTNGRCRWRKITLCL